MTAREIADIIEEAAPLGLQEDWDNSGMQIDNCGAEITGVLLCLDPTEANLREAVEKGCNMVISHHPLFFGAKLRSIDDSDAMLRCLRLAVEKKMAVYSAHTSLDKAREGVSAAMCRKLGLSGTDFLDCPGAEGGLGMTGRLPKPMDEADFLALVKKAFGCAVVKHSPLTGRKIEKVAVCGGSGAFLIGRALEEKADAYVTADLKYHDYFRPEGRMLLCDAGHYETELQAREIFFGLLSKKIDTFAIHFSDSDINPVRCI